MVSSVLLVGGAILLWIGVVQIFSAGERSKINEGETPSSPTSMIISGISMLIVAFLQWVCIVVLNR